MVNECRSATGCSALHIHCNHCTQYSSDARTSQGGGDWKNDCCHRRQRRGWCVGQLSNLRPYLNASSWLQQSEPSYWHLTYIWGATFLICIETQIWFCAVRLVFESVVNKNEATHIDWDGSISCNSAQEDPWKITLYITYSASWLMLWFFLNVHSSLLHPHANSIWNNLVWKPGFVQLFCFMSQNSSLIKQSCKAK